ncbi:DEAD/DEAH box helicase family protein [Crassaminicella profunda]|uniref:DEAD/DEAH box helicase family protein n=1 Tax=Crassaminicella profunda TaxID=1286698 RepID=UPI001CA726C0|nr:DEAD/DEAH box helicase family protein [Crassaminicella profunda]QZY54865.1 DEAD/DEAH box helicase family protein [Crassaminicella profunda]
MVDFIKRLKKKKIDKKIDPIEIYDNIDRKSGTGPLRPEQKKILSNWYEHKKNEKDLIIKLHTGVGKTLVGLLILQSKLNSNEGPCLYVCPNIYLVNQVCEEAVKFGISYCRIGSDGELPDAFIGGKSILITHVQKVFTGKSKFGINNSSTKVGCIILDDSHACIDSINNSFTFNIDKEKNNKLYKSILALFEEELKEQGEGTFLDIQNENYDSLLPIPYWAWDNKKSEILKLLSDNKDLKSIKFVWPLLKNILGHCKAYVNGQKIEIMPYHIPIRMFGTLHLAKNRILMSATTQNDSFFIKGLDFDINAVKHPLVDRTRIWSGEKMILLPSLINEESDRGSIVASFAKQHDTKFGIVALVPSFEKAKAYSNYGAIIAKSEDIYEHILELKSSSTKNKPLIIANRYDGIDLPDDACRILIIDSLPFFTSLSDKYQELCRPSSEIINIRMAQKIEQALGRSVRGEKDFSTILLIGSDLVKFTKSINTSKYFSPQTKKQIAIGIDIAEMTKEDSKEDKTPMQIIIDLINQSLKRDEGWKSYYLEEMDNIVDEKHDDNMYEILLLESKAEKAFEIGNYDDACDQIQKIIDTKTKDDLEQGWYLQELARYTYYTSKVRSNQIQKKAFMQNRELLKPKEGISYKKIEFMNESRIKRIKEWILKFDDFTEFNLQVNSILDDLSFGIDADKFESALKNIGDLLGFVSHRPDKLIRKGPDNLWCVKNNEYMMFECKTEVKIDRKDISKHEVGQMNTHCGWFEKEYNEAKVKRILIIPTKEVSYYADFTHEVFIMRKGKLKTLKKNIKAYIKEFKNYDIRDMSDEKVQELINHHNLSIENLENMYCESYYQKKQ